MKNCLLLIICSILIACSGENSSNLIHAPEIKSILDSAGVSGSVLVYDLRKDVYYSNDFGWAETGHLPASTFKIPNSIIAIEIGAVDIDTTIFKWDGEKRSLKVWEQDLNLYNAFHYSCVPCYQEVARKIGVKRMNDYLNKLNYGNMVVDSSNIDNFWLEGNSTISQFQQIDFLKRFYQSELLISSRTEKIMKQLMIIEENDSSRISGKTGWSTRNGKNNGWFVGYAEKDDNVYFFATNIQPDEEFNMSMFPMIRKEVTYKALQILHIY